MLEPADITEDRLYGGAVRLLQPRRGHRAGTDAVLLAGMASPRPGSLVADVGSASGAAGLMLASAWRDIRLAFVDKDRDLVELCRRNIDLNELGERAQAFGGDLFEPIEMLAAAGFPVGAIDLVVTNPPFFEDSGAGRSSPEPRRRSAHAMAGGTLRGWCAAAARLLKPKGRVVLIHRADALDRCLDVLRADFGSLSVKPIYPKAGEPASRVVIGGTKGGKGPMQVAPAFILHAEDGSFTPEAEHLHRGPPPQKQGAPAGAPTLSAQ